MVNGLTIDLESFQSLNNKEKLDVLYRNTEELKGMVKSYKLTQKVQYAWLGVLTIAIGASKYLGFL